MSKPQPKPEPSHSSEYLAMQLGDSPSKKLPYGRAGRDTTTDPRF